MVSTMLLRTSQTEICDSPATYSTGQLPVLPAWPTVFEPRLSPDARDGNYNHWLNAIELSRQY
jgi:hypothetical protein